MLHLSLLLLSRLFNDFQSIDLQISHLYAVFSLSTFKGLYIIFHFPIAFTLYFILFTLSQLSKLLILRPTHIVPLTAPSYLPHSHHNHCNHLLHALALLHAVYELLLLISALIHYFKLLGCCIGWCYYQVLLWDQTVQAGTQSGCTVQVRGERMSGEEREEVGGEVVAVEDEHIVLVRFVLLHGLVQCIPYWPFALDAPNFNRFFEHECLMLLSRYFIDSGCIHQGIAPIGIFRPVYFDTRVKYAHSYHF